MTDQTMTGQAHTAEIVLPARYALHEDTCDCGCEWDPAFCSRCGWIDCECPTSPAVPDDEDRHGPWSKIDGRRYDRRVREADARYFLVREGGRR